MSVLQTTRISLVLSLNLVSIPTEVTNVGVDLDLRTSVDQS